MLKIYYYYCEWNEKVGKNVYNFLFVFYEKLVRYKNVY